MNDKNSGYLEIILIISFMFGNLILFTGGVNKYGDNWIIILIIAVVVIVDIAVIYYFIKPIIEKIWNNSKQEKKLNSAELLHDVNKLEINSDLKNEEVDNIKKSIDAIIEIDHNDDKSKEKTNAIFEIEHNEEKSKKKTNAINDIIDAINTIKLNYSPSMNLNSNTIKKGEPFKIDRKYVNKGVTYMINNLKDSFFSSLNKCIIVDEKINQILECSGCQDIESTLIYLESKITELQILKAESDLCHRDFERIMKKKIELLNEETEIVECLEETFSALLKSKKCFIKKNRLKNIITNEKPKELDLFDYKSKPITILIFPFYFCLFSNVILVFDKNGVFSIALDPFALVINIKRKSVDCTIINGKFPYVTYAGTDSKCLKNGNEKTTWRYTCIDGSPDLRYHHNPLTSIKINKYEYGIITFSIADRTITMNVSSEKAISAFELLAKKYARKCNDKRDSILSFLQLLEICSESNDESITFLIEKYKKLEDKRNYFCCIKDS